MLRKHRNLWCDLAFRTEHGPAASSTGMARAMLEFPDRFMVGTDTSTPERWHYIVEHARWVADVARGAAARVAETHRVPQRRGGVRQDACRSRSLSTEPAGCNVSDIPPIGRFSCDGLAFAAAVARRGRQERTSRRSARLLTFSESETTRDPRARPVAIPPARDPSNRVSGKPEAMELGEHLFFDRRLSAHGRVFLLELPRARPQLDGQPEARRGDRRDRTATRRRSRTCG